MKFIGAGITVGTSCSIIAGLKLCNTDTSLDGSTVSEILGVANTALGSGGLPEGYTISSINDLVDNINNAFDNAFDNCIAVTEFATLYLCR